MTPTQIESLIERWMTAQVESLEDNLADSHITYERLEELNDGYSDIAEMIHEEMLTSDYRRVGPEVDALLKDAGLSVLNHESAGFKRLCRRLLRAQIELQGLARERTNGNYPDRQVPAPSLVPPTQETTPPDSPLFSEVAALYFKENARAQRTDSQAQSEFKKFLGCIGGDRPRATITKADCRTYKEFVLKDRSQTTCIKHLSSLAGLFKWSEQQGYVPENYNPVRGLAPSKRQAKKHVKPRKIFTDVQLATVLSSPDFLEQRTQNPTRYWVILMCVFQVCRREEASQLMVKDIGTLDGFPYMSVTDEGPEQGLKTGAHSKRRLPIHSSLLALGFLEFVESIKAAGHARLFPDLKKGANGFGDAVGKYFARLKSSVGLDDPGLVLHSTRHTGITKLHSAGVQANQVEMLAGHASQTINGAVYTHRDAIPLRLLRDALERLRYDEVVKALK